MMRERDNMISRLLSEYMIDLDYLSQQTQSMPVDQAMILKDYYLSVCPAPAQNDLEILLDLALISKMNYRVHDTAKEFISDYDETMKHHIALSARDRLRQNYDAVKSKFEYTFLLN
jgi:hypothetical protein